MVIPPPPPAAPASSPPPPQPLRTRLGKVSAPPVGNPLSRLLLLPTSPAAAAVDRLALHLPVQGLHDAGSAAPGKGDVGPVALLLVVVDLAGVSLLLPPPAAAAVAKLAAQPLLCVGSHLEIYREEKISLEK